MQMKTELGGGRPIAAITHAGNGSAHLGCDQGMGLPLNMRVKGGPFGEV